MVVEEKMLAVKILSSQWGEKTSRVEKRKKTLLTSMLIISC
jgi:hypothetical protein